MYCREMRKKEYRYAIMMGQSELCCEINGTIFLIFFWFSKVYSRVLCKCVNGRRGSVQVYMVIVNFMYSKYHQYSQC